MEEILNNLELDIRIRGLEAVRDKLRADNQDGRGRARNLPKERVIRACNETLALLYAESHEGPAGISELRRRNG